MKGIEALGHFIFYVYFIFQIFYDEHVLLLQWLK